MLFTLLRQVQGLFTDNVENFELYELLDFISKR